MTRPNIYLAYLASGLISALIVSLVCLFIWMPEWLANYLRFRQALDYSTFISATRNSVAIFIGSLVACVSALAAIGMFLAAYHTYVVSNQKLGAEALAKGAELLSSTVLSSRLGGIFALQRLAKLSPGDYPTVAALLSSYLCCGGRDEAGKEQRQPSQMDVQVILDGIGHRSEDEMRISTSYDLTGAALTNVRIQGRWSNVCLRGANLFEIDFSYADISGVDLRNAQLIRCTFTGTIIAGAQIQGAAIIQSTNLTAAQVATSIGDRSTVLPGHLVHPSFWLNNEKTEKEPPTP